MSYAPFINCSNGKEIEKAINCNKKKAKKLKKRPLESLLKITNRVESCENNLEVAAILYEVQECFELIGRKLWYSSIKGRQQHDLNSFLELYKSLTKINSDFLEDKFEKKSLVDRITSLSENIKGITANKKFLKRYAVGEYHTSCGSSLESAFITAKEYKNLEADEIVAVAWGGVKLALYLANETGLKISLGNYKGIYNSDKNIHGKVLLCEDQMREGFAAKMTTMLLGIKKGYLIQEIPPMKIEINELKEHKGYFPYIYFPPFLTEYKFDYEYFHKKFKPLFKHVKVSF